MKKEKEEEKKYDSRFQVLQQVESAILSDPCLHI